MHPESLVPPLPDIKVNKELHQKRVTKVGEQCVKFLNHCYLSPTLRFSRYLHKFVSDELPVSDWIAHIREEPHPTNIGQFKTEDGIISTLASEEAVHFRKNSTVFNNLYGNLFSDLSKTNRAILKKSGELAILHMEASKFLN